MKNALLIISIIFLIAILLPILGIETNSVTQFDTYIRDITDEQLVKMVEDEEIPRDIVNLSISSDYITDITPLSKLEDLEFLELEGSQIADLAPLYRLNLSQLYISTEYVVPGSNVSRVGLVISANQINALLTALPECRIIYDDINYGHILGNANITIYDTLELLKYIVGMDNVISSNPFTTTEALIVSEKEPTIFDALEILKYLVGMDGVLKQYYSTGGGSL